VYRPALDGTERGRLDENARLESLLLPVRNLVEFLEAPGRARKRHSDDLWSDNFLDSAGQPIHGIRVGLTVDDRDGLNKYLSHMTVVRVTKRVWAVAEIRQKVNAAMKEFLDRLNPAVFPSNQQKTKRDFEILLGNRC
jgi:hypothetical protein